MHLLVVSAQLVKILPPQRDPARRAEHPLRPHQNPATPFKQTPEIARELRKLAHDLSNALETILQAGYLVSQSEMPKQSLRWVEMIEQASQEAVAINRKLREILRTQS